MEVEVKNQRWDEDLLFAVRKEVLEQWHTGKELAEPRALEEAIEYQKQQPWWKFASLRNARAKEEDSVQVMGQVGHATVEQTVEHIKHCDAVEPERQLMLTDTYSRKNQYKLSQEAIERSYREGFSLLNGYPVVPNGVKGARRVNECTRAAIGTDSCDEDSRLGWEIALAGGWTYGSIQTINEIIAHGRDYPMERMITNFQYNDRLSSYYTERGIPVLGRATANMGCWDPPAFKVAISIIQTLLSAEQGVKHIDISLGLGMNLIQDVAALRTLDRLAKEYLARFGHGDVKTYLWTYFWLGDWPTNRDAIASMLAWNTAEAVLGGVVGMCIKSLDEASSTPTKEGFLSGFTIIRQIIRVISGQRLAEGAELRQEEKMTELTARAIVDRVLDLGDGDLAVGSVRAIDAGVIDGMFLPYRRLKHKVLVVRDRQGALRYLDAGDLPLPKEVVEYHREKIAEQEAHENSKADLEWVIREATRMSEPLTKEESLLTT